MKAAYRITLWEMERGWGRSHLMDQDFDSLEAAVAYRNQENAKNTELHAPDYYVYADDPVLVDVERNPPR